MFCHICRYDPLQNSWEKLAEMQEKRCSFSVAVLDGTIYAIGGHCDPDYLDSVEQYCSITNSWRYLGADTHFSKCYRVDVKFKFCLKQSLIL